MTPLAASLHLPSPDQARSELLSLLAEKAYREGNFTLSSGARSSFYIDARAVTLTARGAHLAALLVLEYLKDLPVEAVGGLTLGADPLVCATSALSSALSHPLDAFLIRKAAKGHGTAKRLEGPLPKGPVALLDDVTTTGGSTLEAFHCVRAEAPKARVEICLALLDREEGAREALSAHNLDFKPLFTLSELRRYLKSRP